MENPYYEIITLIKSLAKSGDSTFSADIGISNGKPVVKLDGGIVNSDFWVPDSLDITEDDDGCPILCAPFDRGFLILAKLWQL